MARRRTAYCPHCRQKHVYQADYEDTIRRCDACGQPFKLKASGATCANCLGCLILIFLGIVALAAFTTK